MFLSGDFPAACMFAQTPPGISGIDVLCEKSTISGQFFPFVKASLRCAICCSSWYSRRELGDYKHLSILEIIADKLEG